MQLEPSLFRVGHGKNPILFQSDSHSALCVFNMAGSLSSSMEGTGFSDSDMSADESTSTVAHREKNLMSLLKQENRVLKMELETCKLRCKQLQEENRALRQASVSIVSLLCLCAELKMA